ncbi:glycoside hydrolase family 25 protein [Clostridium sp. MT-14]|uniref:glycoside hydrolase family 25 protein n=1 Tax=Clostridium sp. MT-14 TaxID=3348360 RepID=UPI0035F2504A
MIKGVDISNLNGPINMGLIKNAGNSFVIAKATEGSTFVDKFYNDNIRRAKALGLVTGAYAFGRFATKEKAIQEANFFKQIAAGAEPDFVVLDFEQQCSGDMTDACLAFLDAISSIAPAVIYCNPSYIKEHLNSKITKYPLWVAHYGVNSPGFTLWSKYAIWQYTDKGQISGVSGCVDLNYMAEDFYNLVKGGKKKMDAIVIYNYGADMHSAELLADFLNCPTISNARKFDYSQVKNVYAVGGKKEQYTSYLTELISGTDRYETAQAVLNFIKNGGK